jgi:hypothetical protein
MKNCRLHDPATLEMLHDYPLEELRCHPAIPDAGRVHDNDRASSTNTETRRLTPLDPRRTKQQSLALKQ